MSFNGTPFPYSIFQILLYLFPPSAFVRSSKICPYGSFLLNFCLMYKIMPIVDFFGLYPRCVSSVIMLIIGGNLFGIIAAHILYIDVSRALGL